MRLKYSTPNCVCLQCGKPFHRTPSEIAKNYNQFCSRHCTGLSRRQAVFDPSPPLCACGCGKPVKKAGTRARWNKWIHGHHAPSFLPSHKVHRQAFASRFWQNVDKTDDCWLWTGRLNSGGYGVVKYKGKDQTAHRVSYDLNYGSIPEGMDICHSCDVKYPPHDITYRHCIRPDHLWPGDAAANRQDCVAKGRHTIKQGEDNGNVKLTRRQVAEIRSCYSAGNVSQAALAKEYSVNQSAISCIVRRATWRHVR